jgi:predicted DNA-binding transcriptional regulator AlpA
LDRFIGEPERCEITGYSRGHWFKLEQRGDVPQRVKLGRRKVGWRLSEIMKWMEERAALRDTARATGGDDARPAA